ncbi:MAG: PilZ domain-containing protein [Nitrospira sp.]|nr:PilZ domain-containing protein [Nitrospira sp.]
MILRLDCPACKRDSYSAAVNDFRPCPYCGIIFSGRYGVEKRDGVRIKKELPVALTYGKRALNASTADFSQKGIRLQIFENALLPVGDTFNFAVKNTLIKAQVMWVKNKTDAPATLAGLKILDGKLNLLGML